MRRTVVRPILEACLIVAVGLIAGLVANAADDRHGIALSKDHLRRGAKPATAAPQPTAAPVRPEGGTADAAVNAATPASSHPDSPFTFIDHETAVAVYEGDGYQYGEDIFIDARDDAHYAEGHVPGAYQLDHYRADRYLPDLLPVCQNALRIVVYCNGGNCEDSQLAAEDLMLQGINPDKICVYEAGITRWRAERLPLETGERLSGQLAGEE